MCLSPLSRKLLSKSLTKELCLSGSGNPSLSEIRTICEYGFSSSSSKSTNTRRASCIKLNGGNTCCSQRKYAFSCGMLFLAAKEAATLAGLRTAITKLTSQSKAKKTSFQKVSSRHVLGSLKPHVPLFSKSLREISCTALSLNSRTKESSLILSHAKSKQS